MDGDHQNTLADRLNLSPDTDSEEKCASTDTETPLLTGSCGKTDIINNLSKDSTEACDSKTSRGIENTEANGSCDIIDSNKNDLVKVSGTVTQLQNSEKRTDASEEKVEMCYSKKGAEGANNLDEHVERDSAVGEKNCDTFVDSCENVVEEDGSEESGSDEDYESAEEGEEIQTDTQNLRDLEESLTDEEKEERRKSAQELKEEGNDYFRSGSYKTAIKAYCRALRTCPLKFVRDRAIMYSNRAACKMKLDDLDGAIRDSGKAVELHPHYLKALMRRAELYERTEKLDEALTDFQRILELDPGQYSARAACARLPDMIKDRNEKLKEEMMSKLKDLGNLVLRPFGLSTNNFQLNQDPNSGGYSVNFVQNPDQNANSQ